MSHSTDAAMPLDQLLRHLQKLVERSLALWDLPDAATVRCINVSENVTYLVEAADEFRAVLRVHREAYHTENAISCELDWKKFLKVKGWFRRRK